MINAGPYISTDYDELYLPVEFWTYNKATTEAAEWAREFLDQWGRARYVAKDKIQLHNHEDWEDILDDCPYVLAWRFDIYEV